MNDLITLINKNPNLLPKGSNPSNITKSLLNINKMIGMKDVKDYIIKMIKMIMMAPNEFDNNHVLLTGAPGTGKTTLAKNLGELFYNLKIIGKNTTANDSTIYDIENSIYHYKKAIKYMNDITDSRTKNFLSIKEKRILKNIIKITECHSDILTNLYDQSETSDDNNTVKFTILTASDLVSPYIGDTHTKAKEALEKARGGVVFIDEFYAMGINDRHSEQALVVINEYMSLYPDEYIFIFAGYKDKIENTVFKLQPGLISRFNWNIHIDNYTSIELADILKSSVELPWKFDPKFNIVEWVTNNMDLFPYNGRSVKNILRKAKEIFCQKNFHKKTRLLSKDIFDSLSIYKNKQDDPPNFMYI